MGLFAIILTSLLIPHRQGERSGDLEDAEKAHQEVGPAVDDSEQQSRDLESKDDITDYNEGPDPQEAGEDESDSEPSQPGRRVTFGTPSGGSGPPPKKTPAKPGVLARLKTIILPPQEKNKPLSSHRTLPVISGLVIPFSILLEIPGLTDSWYLRTYGNVVVETRPNPVSFDVLLAMSMLFAVLANLSLICRFLEKGPVLVTTLITIASLTIHGNAILQNVVFDCVSRCIDLINITVIVVFGVQHRFHDGFTYGHGYWMTGMFAVSEFCIELTNRFSVFHRCVGCY